MTIINTKDKVYLNDLIKAIESTLGEYDESWYEQIDILRYRISQFSDMLNDDSNSYTGESAFYEASNQLEHDFYMANR